MVQHCKLTRRVPFGPWIRLLYQVLYTRCDLLWLHSCFSGLLTVYFVFFCFSFSCFFFGQGWTPTNDIESVVVQIRAQMVVGKARIDFDNPSFTQVPSTCCTWINTSFLCLSMGENDWCHRHLLVPNLATMKCSPRSIPPKHEYVPSIL